jgi:hypothetical protein
MRFVNAFWGVCGESAWITCLSSASSSCIVSCVPTSRISTGHDHIKASTSRFPKEKFLPFRQVNMVIALSRFQFCAGYTTSTEEWPERFKRRAILAEEMEFRIPSCF